MCTICQDNIFFETESEAEKPSELDCHHTYHKECIDHWLLFKHHCPTCRAPVDVEGEEQSFIPDMTAEEVMIIPDTEETPSPERLLEVVRARVLSERQIRQVQLDEDTALGQQARRVHAVFREVYPG